MQAATDIADLVLRSDIEDVPGEIVTFYSYKGGTGRSMALANVAGLLAPLAARRGKRILAVDFDLEAPGLHHYLRKYLESHADEAEGTLEWFERIDALVRKRMGGKPLTYDMSREVVADSGLEKSVQKTRIDGLDLMKAGNVGDAQYGRRVNRFGWEALFNNAPSVFRAIAEQWGRQYLYVLIDSRTGVTDISGICTMLLPDTLVVVFTPNTQSLTGIDKLVSDAVRYRTESIDLRPLRMLPLVSRVDAEREELRTLWRHGGGDVALGFQPLFESLVARHFGQPQATLSRYFDQVQVHHSPDYAFGEKLAFDLESSTDSLSIRQRYEAFLPWLASSIGTWEDPVRAQATFRFRRELAAFELERAGDEAWFDQVLRPRLRMLQTLLIDAQRQQIDPRHRADAQAALALALMREGDLQMALAEMATLTDIVRGGGAVSNPLLEAFARVPSHWKTRMAPAAIAPDAAQQMISAVGELLSAGVDGPSPLLALHLRGAAEYYDWAGRPALAVEAWKKLVSACEAVFGRDDPQTLDATEQLAEAMKEQGDPAAALELEKRVLEMRRESLGEDHRDTVTAMGKLAHTMRTLGDLPGARALHERVLAFRLRQLGERDPETRSAMSHLAAAMRAQGELDGARELQERVLRLTQEALGDRHRDTIDALSNLAGTFRALGRLQEARELFERALDARRELCGAEHLDTLDAMNNLAAVLNDLNELQAARELEQAALDARRAQLGPDHPSTLIAMNNLANTLFDLGDFQGARQLEERVLEARRRTLGDRHPATLNSMNNLAGTLRSQGMLGRAKDLEEEVVTARKEVLGEEHPDTLTSMNNLATTLRLMGELERALELQERVLRIRVEKLGEQHRDTLNSMSGLGQIRRARGDLQIALALHARTLELRRRSLGESHVDTVSSMQNLGATLFDLKDYAAARSLEEQVLGLRRAQFGEDHPETLNVMGNLASTLRAQGELRAARELQEGLLDARRRTLGDAHPDTLATVNSLAETLNLLGDTEGARALLDQALKAALYATGSSDAARLDGKVESSRAASEGRRVLPDDAATM